MRRDLLSGVTLVMALGSGLAQAEPLSAQRQAIVDGRAAGDADLIATVAITDAAGEDSFCTGTLIAPRVVVTAAHCVVVEDEETQEVQGEIPAGDMRVVAGGTNAFEADDDMIYTVARVVVHPGYPNESEASDASGANRYDDVALLILDDGVTQLTPAVIPDLAEAEAALADGVEVTITGFGTTASDGEDGGVLHIAETSYQGRFNAEIVLGSPGEPDTCPGDSGGPAYLLGDGDAWLVGVTSRSVETAQATCGEGGIYAFAPFYRGWIASNSDGLYTGASTEGDNPPGNGGDDGDEFDDEDFEDDEGCQSTGSGPGASLFLWLPLVMLGRRRRRA